MQRTIYRLLCFCFFVISYNTVKAIDERYAAPELRGNQLAADSTSMVMDTVYFNPALKPLQTTYFVKNLITFQIDESYRQVLPDEFDVSVTFKVHYTYDDNGTPSTDVTDNITLTIGYSQYTRYGFKATYIADDWWYKAEIEIIGISAGTGTLSEFRDALVLTNEILINREYDFSCTNNAVQTIYNNTSTVTMKGELKVYWVPERVADEYDLEWTYVDSSALANYYKTGDTTHFDPKKLFPGRATRVNIAKEEYNIPLLFEGNGSLFYRVRAVQIKSNGQRIESVWSSDFSNGLGQYDYRGLDTMLNWQASTSFAEEGKRKSVVQYFDGSLKSRQTVTKDNTTDTTIIAETFYDHQGRPVIQVMPTPSLSSIIKYTPGFNRPLNNAEYTKDVYDGLLEDTCFCKQGVPVMDTAYGAAKYYSPHNHLATNGYHKYIPDARGFVFAETRYTPDNTGRISVHGGVADTFQIGSGHETNYTYNSADQEELDALFGTEVGNASHYFKNTARDANGQVSISYVDMHGRTIATALAGKAGVLLDTLASNNSYFITKKLLDSTSNVVKGMVIESSKGLVVTKAGPHQFIYSLLPDSVSIKDCQDSTICYDCIYDLEITITDECNDSTKAVSIPVVINRTNYHLETVCDSILQFPAVDTTLYLREGSYLVTKKLTINKQAMDYYRDSIFLVRNTCQTLEQAIQQQKELLLTSIQCEPTCESCRTGLGDWETYRNNYMQQAGIPNSDTVNYRVQAELAYNKASLECAKLCDSTGLHHNIREQMLIDVTPPLGQYANPGSIDQYSVFWFSDVYPQPAYKIAGDYKDENGYNDPLDPKGLNQEQFIDEFKSSWAETLLEMHPEYLKLKKYEELAKSHIWDTHFQNTETYQAAIDSGYLNPGDFSTHPTGSIFNYNSAHRDPFFTDLITEGKVPGYYKSRMQDSLLIKTLDTSSNPISMWSLATIMAHCPGGDVSCLYHYKHIDSAFAIGSDCTGDLDMAWKYFREMYLQEKREFIALILNEAQQQSERFADLTEMVNNHTPNFYDPAMMPPGNMPSDATAGRDSVATFINNNCTAYVKQWWEELKPCGFDSDDSLVIVPRLVQVCREGGDTAHLFGASTVKPSSTYTYKSFEEVLKAYCDSTSIDYNANCNVYLINAPLPYDQQPVYYEKPIYQKPDSCECATIASLYQQYEFAGIDSSFSDYLYRTTGTRMYQGVLDTLRMACNGQINCSFLKEPLSLPPVLQCEVKNICVTCAQVETLYRAYTTEFPEAVPQLDNNDSLQQVRNRLFEQFMNTHLGFGKQTADYLAFMDDCEVKTGNDTSLIRIKDEFVNDYFNYGIKYDSYGCDTATWKATFGGWNNNTSVAHKDIFKNGIAQYPDSLPALGHSGVSCDFVERDSACIDRHMSLEFRMKMPQPMLLAMEIWLNHGPISSPDTKAKFYINLGPTTSQNHISFYDWGILENNRSVIATPEFWQDYSYWRKVKFEMVDSLVKFFVDDSLLKTISFPSNIDLQKFLGFDWASYSSTGAMPVMFDWVKAYDKDNKLFYFEDFNDCGNFSHFAPYIQCPRQPCTTAFTNYFNQQKQTNYTWSQIDSIYVAHNITMNICDSSGLTLCGKTEPVFAPVVLRQHSSCDDTTLFAHSTGIVLHEAYSDSLLNSFNDRYLARCLNARYQESFTLYQPISEFHYTLYYYDQAGNLLKTIPPAGIDVSKFAWARAWSDSVTIARRNKELLTPGHSLPTQYRYNTLNQVVAQQSPDGGLSEFWYDRLGRLAISRNARQKGASGTEENRLYSYTKYDSLGRITEVGQVSNTSANGAMTDVVSRNQASLDNWLATLNSRRGQITSTVYDLPYPGFEGIGDERLIIKQKNLRNRVSYTTLTDTGTSNVYNQGTFYTYDILGNVDWLLQDYGSSSYSTTANVMNKNDNRWKKTGYKYDLISGKVNMVMYQHGWKDGFFHRYSYDSENRLTLVETSLDSLVWEKEARYDYYRHGPLARATLGDQQVQGLDYAYTLQGWLKGINSTGGTDSLDMGGDGNAASLNRYTAKDAIGLTLNYFGNDYSAVNGNPFPGYSAYLPTGAYRPLYNGNISSSSVFQRKFDTEDFPGGPLIFYNYKYDQLNRLTGQDAFTGFNSASNSWSGITTMGEKLKERIAYDANGNILKYLRKSISGTAAHMDSLNYFYYANTNRLKGVTDSVPANTYTSSQDNLILDIDGQPENNYTYDAIGNLIKDSAEKLTSIKWSVYGKIQEISRTPTEEVPVSNIKYSYDALGNRISQIVTSGDTKYYTWYVRDAQGNLLSTYTANGSSSDLATLDLKQSERYLYGSSRLGVFSASESVDGGPDNMQYYYGIKGYDRGYKQYELSNHLGNVLATISDRKFGIPSDTNSSLIDHYEPHIETAQDYYPFGMLSRVALPNSGVPYKFGFNGKMNDNEVKGLGNQQDYGMRIIDPRLGRFLSVDPITKQFPWYTPYQFSGNKPIAAIDLDGLEELWITNNCFAPFDLFGSDLFGSYSGDGEKRKFGDGGTYRTSGRAHINLTTGEKPTYVAGSSTSTYHRKFGPDYVTQSSSKIEDENYSSSRDNNYHHLQMHVSGSNKASLFGAFVDIDNNVDIYFRRDPQNKLKVLVHGSVQGDRFPANETILNDKNGNKLILSVSSHNGPNKDLGPYVNLPGYNKRDMQKFSMTILFNDDETFRGVEFGGKKYSIEEWNKQFSNLDPKDKKISTTTTTDGKISTKKSD